MDLSNGSRGTVSFLEVVERLTKRTFLPPLYNIDNLFLRKGRHFILKLLEFDGPVRREEVNTRAEDLTELYKC